MNGLKLSSHSFKDWDWSKLGLEKADINIPFEHDITGIPVVYQGTYPSCVSCSLTWLQQFFESSHPELSWEWLAKISGTDQTGVELGDALEAARKVGICTEETWKSQQTEFEKSLNAANHKIPGYAYVIERKSIIEALSKYPLLVTVKDYNGSGPHCMVATGVIVNEQGELMWKGVNWDNANQQGVFYLPLNAKFEKVVAVLPAAEAGKPMSILSVLLSKIQNAIPKFGLPVAGLAISILAVLLGTSFDTPQKFGNAGVATSYRSVIAGSGISSSATSIPVSTVTLYTGESITTSTLQFPVYLMINQNGTTQEQVECWNLSVTTTNPTWTGCVRGLSALGGATSTYTGAAKSHSPGENVIMSNTGPFYNRFVDVYTAQFVSGVKTFISNAIKIGDNISASSKYIYFPDGQTNAPYFRVAGNGSTSTFYMSTDGTSEFQLNASGTTLGASSTRGIALTAGLMAVNLGNSGNTALANGLTFNAGTLSVAPSSTSFLFIDSDGYLSVSSTALASSTAITPAGYYGDGSMGASTTAVGTTTLTGDVFFTRYVVSTGTTLLTNGYRIFSSLSFINNGVVSCDGSTGTNGVALSVSSTGGLGCGSATGTLPKGFDGGYGAAGVAGGSAGLAGGAGSSTALNIARLPGVAGGAGANSDPAGSVGAGGAAGANQSLGILPRAYPLATLLMSVSGTGIFPSNLGPSNGGGGGGLGASSGRGGDGGGAGGNGGAIFIASPVITNNHIIRANGGQGGNGGTAQTGGGGSGNGGGGGGAGGNGGIVILITKYFSGNTPLVTGGTAGSGGAGTGTSASGSSGTAGRDGTVFTLN